MIRWLGSAIAVIGLLAALAWNHWLRPRLPRMPALSSTIQHGTLEHDGHERTYLFYVPKNPALIIFLTGGHVEAAKMREATAWEFEVLADQHGFVVVYPEPIGGIFNACRIRETGESNKPSIDDVGYVQKLIDHFAATLSIDRAHVFAAGMSVGGDMAMRLAVEAPDRVGAVAVIGINLPVNDRQRCSLSGKPVPFLLMNGTADPIVPYNGGEVSLFGLDSGGVRSTRETVDYFRQLAGHDQEPRRETLPDNVEDDGSSVERLTWQTVGHPEVVLYTIHGGGHTIPHPTLRFGRIVGVTNGDINAPHEIWSFFERTMQANAH
ncbi:alpha/beta hydrolase family esterase [Myxococcota bacterium]